MKFFDWMFGRHEQAPQVTDADIKRLQMSADDLLDRAKELERASLNGEEKWFIVVERGSSEASEAELERVAPPAKEGGLCGTTT